MIMKHIHTILTALLIGLSLVSCRETYDMMPVPEPPEVPPARFETMYMVGGATPNGWNIDDATPLTPNTANPDLFEWTGELVKGELKFTIDRQSDWAGAWFLAAAPDMEPTGEEQPMRFCASGNDGADDKWKIIKAGTYAIALDARREVVTITLTNPGEEPEQPEGRFETLYFVGSYTDWNFEAMRRDALNPNVFRYGREFKGEPGEFKFATQAGSWDNMIHPTVPDASYTHPEIMIGEEAGDFKWKLNPEETNLVYKMVVDVTEGTETFSMTEFSAYSTIYMVGDATPAGWNVTDATPLDPVTDDPYTFTWTGELQVGNLKFTCDRQADWGGAFFMAYEPELEPDGSAQQMRFSPAGDGGADDKWKIKTAGTYTIVLNQLQETLTIIPN